MSPCVIDIELEAAEHALGQDDLHGVVIADSVGSQVADVAEPDVRSNRSARQKAVEVPARGYDVRAFIANIADLQAQILPQALLDVKVPVLHVWRIPVP